MITTLVLDKTLVDQDLLENIVSPDYKNGKKGSLIRKDDSICDYFIIDTRIVLTGQEEQTRVFNTEMYKARTQGYHYVMFK